MLMGVVSPPAVCPPLSSVAAARCCRLVRSSLPAGVVRCAASPRCCSSALAALLVCRSVKARGSYLRVHFKNTRETCQAVKGLTLKRAKVGATGERQPGRQAGGDERRT